MNNWNNSQQLQNELLFSETNYLRLMEKPTSIIMTTVFNIVTKLFRKWHYMICDIEGI